MLLISSACVLFMSLSVHLSSASSSMGFHVVAPPSRQQLLAQLNFTSTPTYDHPTPRAQPKVPGIGKGFLDIFRSRHSPRRGPIPIPYPGSPILRPQLPPTLHTHPSPHLTLSPSSIPNKDRIGGAINTDGGPNANVFTTADGQLESGFLPSKRLQASHPVNSSTLQLPPPKVLCDFYTDSLCIDSHPYPYVEMQRSFPMEIPALRRLLTDVQHQNAEQLTDGVSIQDEALYTFEHYYGYGENNSHSYKDYGADGGFICPSDIRYVRPKRARNPRGQWKTIVNLGDPSFTQTIRVEKCLKPFSRCSYVFSYLNSECIQIYNYQRLASWDEKRGFHTDIYKIPVACSCHLRSSSNLRPVSSVQTPSPSADSHQFLTEFNQTANRIDSDLKPPRKPQLFVRPTMGKPTRILSQDIRNSNYRHRMNNIPANQQNHLEAHNSHRFQPQMMIGHRQSDTVDRVNYEVNPVSDYMHTWGRR